MASLLNLSDLPTEYSLSTAQSLLQSSLTSLSSLDAEISAAQTALARLVQESQSHIHELQTEHARLEVQAAQARAYLSPIRRMPAELLRDVFLWCFEDHPCCAWVLAAVSCSWRRLALRMPKIWSKIRLITTQHASADTIRLWLERSGNTVPLDIELFLRVTNPNNSSDPLNRFSRNRRRLSSTRSRTPSPPPWAMSFSPSHGIAAHYVIPHQAHHQQHHHYPLTMGGTAGITILPPAQTPIVISSSPSPPPAPVPGGGGGAGGYGWPVATSSGSRHQSSSDRQLAQSRSSLHWGHVAVYYLAEQMHRWERFIFRFDKQFTSMSALKSINGDAPLLREFEVSSAEPVSLLEWQWLPNAPSSTKLVLPNLRTLTLQNTPFKWSSPMLRTNLHTLNLHALSSSHLPSSHLPLDRILYIVSNNPELECLRLYFPVVLSPVLPLTRTTLSRLRRFEIGGHYMLSQLVDAFELPLLEQLSMDIEPREPVEDTITGLLGRSGRPNLTDLSIGYGSPSPSSSSSSSLSGAGAGPAGTGGGMGMGLGMGMGIHPTSTSFYYGPTGVISWGTLLGEMGSLKRLYVGGTPLEPLLTTLGVPDDELGLGPGPGGLGGDGNGGTVGWACPKLEVLGMRNCHAHSEAVGKLVYMVEARNPSGLGSMGGMGNGGGTGNGGGGGGMFGGGGGVGGGVLIGEGAGAGGAGGGGGTGIVLPPVRLKVLELHDYANLGEDVLAWLKSRIREVVVRAESEFY